MFDNWDDDRVEPFILERSLLELGPREGVFMHEYQVGGETFFFWPKEAIRVDRERLPSFFREPFAREEGRGAMREGREVLQWIGVFAADDSVLVWESGSNWADLIFNLFVR